MESHECSIAITKTSVTVRVVARNNFGVVGVGTSRGTRFSLSCNYFYAYMYVYVGLTERDGCILGSAPEIL